MKLVRSYSIVIVLSLCFLNLLVPARLSAATVAYWNFEDGTPGAIMNPGTSPAVATSDLSGNGYDMWAWASGTANNSPWFSAEGETPESSGLSAFFSGGQDGYTTNAAINSWSPAIWTIEVSVQLDSLSGWLTFIGRNGSSSPSEASADFYFQNNGIDNRFRINFRTVGNERVIVDSDFVPAAGQWYRLAVVSDGTDVTMYADQLDGNGFQVVGSAVMSGATPGDNALIATNFAWTFGRGWYSGNNVDFVRGYIDDIRFSDAALTPEQFLGYTFVNITESDGLTALFEGDVNYTDDYSIVLLQEPTEDVLVTVSPPDDLDVGNGSGQDLVLTFTDLDWDQAQTVTVQIADANAQFADVERIQHSIQSDDLDYHESYVRDVLVHIQEDACGIWGYLEADYNLNCFVDLEDFAILARVWLAAEAPLDLQTLASDWLVSSLQYDQEVYARSVQESNQPFSVNTAYVQNTVDEKIFGHFLEHIYHSANGGLWGELVWNRSFEMNGSGTGVWTIEGDDLVQSSPATDIHMEFGDPAWDDYEMTLEARKDGGSEGFLIVFRAPDSDNFYWLNLGGWGNTQHAIEKEVNGGRSIVSSVVSGSIALDQWYDIRIRCEGNHIQVWLDEGSNPDPILDYTDTDSPYLTGMVGLGTWGSQARYRNIQVTEIPSTTVLFSGLPSIPETGFSADFWESFGSGTFALTTDSLNDDFSVKITTAGGDTGLQQDNFKFTPQAYHGSLWMKGTIPAGLSVSLLDGTTVLGQTTLSAPTSSWDEYSFSITPSAGTDNGSLRITLPGAGTVYIDQVSMMGQDAIDTGGFRPDLLGAVEGLRPPVIRWPGGYFAELYRWKDGIGPQHTRSKYPIVAWDDQDTNSFGTDEFMKLCRTVGAEPIVVINIGSHDAPEKEADYVLEAQQWVEYCNGPVDSTWGAIRAANGHPEPYNVKYWEIDNEVWFQMDAATYSSKLEVFVPALKAVDPNILIIACGSGSYDQAWNRTVIDNCADLIDYISTHHYENPDSFKQGPRDYEAFIEELGAYIAASSNPDIKIYMSEWNAQSTDWRTGLYAGGLLNAFERTGDVFEIGGPALFLRHTSATGWDNAFINFDHTGWFPAPNYVVMKLWHDHYGPNRVRTTGADTNLNVVTTMSADEQTLYIHVVNPDPGEKSAAFEIDSSFIPETAYMEYVAPGSLSARNTLAAPDAVHVQAKVVGIDGQILRLLVPGYSAGVITVQTTQPHVLITKYLYSFFQGNGDGLHLAYSDDGLTFTPLKNNTTFLTPQIGSNLMRDPSICRGPDGVFHMVWTTGWNDDGIGIAHSPDLINWSTQTYLPVMASEPYVYNCWAPEIFYDEVTGKYLIFWSSTLTPGSTNDHRVYSISTEDFVTYTDTALFYDPGWSCIDAFIAKDGDRYAMVLKDERDSGKNIRITFSDHAAGPYAVPPSASITPAGLWVEGPSMVEIGQEWILYYDAYTSGYMGGQSSTDLETWIDRRSQISFPSGTRHGTVFKVTEDILSVLLEL